MPGPVPAALTHPAAYPVLRDVSPRYSDLGPDGRISAIGLTRWFEDARVGVELPAFRRLVEDGEFGAFRVLLAGQGVERLDAMPFDGKYRIGLGVRRVGGSSFTYGYGVFCDDRCVALGDTVTVFATEAGPAHLPDALRSDLAGLVLDEPDASPSYRPGPERRDRSSYPFAVSLRARVGDIDTNRHVNNVALVSWYADGVAALHDELLTPGWGGPSPELAPSSFRVQYVAEVGYPAEYEIGVAVLGVDAGTGDAAERSSTRETVTYGLGVFLGDRCVGLADATGTRGELDANALDAWRMIGG
ncbi:acyl-ACP thioesterase domain-containing protein [Actinomycetospora termitidis]|uniref:Thioesterase n=1 Tax=Actinomycetospora termitidis TaxID=3053470 RepID=A0ABT7ME94_9PSEU|nr:acyl-ACP thioesterase domain-containing protein [Actinomycetospora sp. Odt1-22]MDL5158207.1 thioesterase [Actinomycetospora sp. Odt1-22]